MTRNSYYFDGIDRDNPKDSPNITVNAADNVTISKGRHELKTGFAFQHVMVQTFETGQPGGDYNFSGLFTAQMDPASAAMGTYNVQVPDTGAGPCRFAAGLCRLHRSKSISGLRHTAELFRRFFPGQLEDQSKAGAEPGFALRLLDAV